MGKRFRRCVFMIAMAAALLPFPTVAMSLGTVSLDGDAVPIVKTATLDIGPHVAVCGLNPSMQMGQDYYIEVCAWNGNDSGGTAIVGADVWYEIRTATGGNVASSSSMKTDDSGRAKFTQHIGFGPGRFRVTATMSYLGGYYGDPNWAYFDVYEVVVPVNHPPCPWKTPNGTIYCW